MSGQPKPVGEVLAKAAVDWFEDKTIRDRDGKCGKCGGPCTLSAFATACAMTFNRTLKQRRERPLDARDIARCPGCYSLERKDGPLYGYARPRSAPAAAPEKSLDDWREAYDR